MTEQDRIAAKLAKRAAKARAKPARIRNKSVPPMPDSVPIVWCVETGVERCHRGHWCDTCKVYTQTEAPIEEWDDPFPDPRPTVPCRQCGEPVPMNSRGLDREMMRVDTGELFPTHRDLPLGACWAQVARDDDGLHNWVSSLDATGKPFEETDRRRLIDRPGPDGRVLVVKLPDGHDWVIDSRANNCTLPHDDEHWCWVREGRPEDRTLHVGKGGRTCSAGAGSIATGRYHGFLRHGHLVKC